MVSTPAMPGAFDGLERAEPDEPVFTLRAHDVLAPKLVLDWVERKRALINGNTKLSKRKRRAELIQCREAEEVAFAMIEWQKGQAAPTPITDGPAKPSYSGNGMGADELAVKVKFDTLVGASAKLNNAVADIADASEMLEPYGHATERGTMAGIVKNVQVLSDAIRPKRRSYAHLSDTPIR